MLAAILVLYGAGVTTTIAQPPDTVTAVCSGCHGEAGISSNPMVPTLAGQPYTLIEDNLLAFRNGLRACSPERNDGSPPALLAQTMCATVSSLSDQEIAALAAYFEALPFEPARQVYEPELAVRGAQLHQAEGCERCHADGGRTTNAMAPILAGQWTPYLRRSMDAIQSGTKKGPKIMNAAFHELDEKEVEALLNYYASGPEGADEGPQS